MNLPTGAKLSDPENELRISESSGRWAKNGTWLRDHRCFLICVLAIWVFFIWVIANTPYGLDDWRWGIPAGFEDFVTGSQNGRYLGNLFEVIVTRSGFLKVLLIATMATMLPLLSVILVHSMVRPSESEPKPKFEPDEQKFLVGMLLSATLMYLAVPREVWRQTFGWIAGFSNFGFSGVLLLLDQKYLFEAQSSEQAAPLRILVLSALTAFCASLILENLTVYLAAVTLLSSFFYIIHNRRCNARHLALLLGCLAGTALMFGGSIYGTLFSTGRAWNDMRSLTVNLHDGVWTNLRILHARFVYFFPHEIWGDQWVPCTLIASLLALKGHRSRRKAGRVLVVPLMLFACYFVSVRFLGPIENYVARWSDVLTQRLNLLFFWLVLLAVIAFWRENRDRRKLLLFLWLSVPCIVVPLLVTNTTGQDARCILTPAVVLIEFCLVLIADADPLRNDFVKKALSILLAVLLMASAGEKLVVSAANGRIMKERDALVKSAREGNADSLYFPDFPYLDYLWVTEPLGDRQIGFFREFYGIPEDVEISFNTGNLEDYDFYAHIRSE